MAKKPAAQKRMGRPPKDDKKVPVSLRLDPLVHRQIKLWLDFQNGGKPEKDHISLSAFIEDTMDTEMKIINLRNSWLRIQARDELRAQKSKGGKKK